MVRGLTACGLGVFAGVGGILGRDWDSMEDCVDLSLEKCVLVDSVMDDSDVNDDVRVNGSLSCEVVTPVVTVSALGCEAKRPYKRG